MLFFYPEDLEIISRRIYYTHTSGILKRNATEKITFKNTSERILPEIILEVEKFKPNLKIIDNNGNELVFQPNYKIEEQKNIPEDILNAMHEKGPGKKRYILLIELNQPVEKDEYYSIHLDYIEYAQYITDKKDKKNKSNYEKSVEQKHFIWKETGYTEWISFYANETLSIFNHWEDGLSIENGDLGIIDRPKNSKGYPNNSDQLDNEKIHLDFRKNFFSFSISNKYRTQENITSVGITYTIKPENSQIRLMQTLTVFVLFFPGTDIISLILHNISYLFDSLEIERVFILTLAFAQTRTRLLSLEKWIKWALIIAGALFVFSILFLLNIR